MKHLTLRESINRNTQHITELMALISALHDRLQKAEQTINNDKETNNE